MAKVSVPMWEVNLDGEPLHTDSFYADLDGDGLPEVAITRVLGNPEAMQRQLSETAESGGPEATILCSEDTRIHLETQRFLDALAQQGHEVAVLGRGGAEHLSQSDLIIHFGHGSPKRLSNRFGESFVTAKSMPMLPRHPIAIVDGCATTPPGSALLRAFLNNGGRAYLGSTATVWGMIPARYTNQLVMHFLDTYEAHPEWTLAKLLTVSISALKIFVLVVMSMEICITPIGYYRCRERRVKTKCASKWGTRLRLVRWLT